MPAHLWNRNGIWYLVDGESAHSLKTPVKRHADALLRQYNDKKYHLAPLPTVAVYYPEWIGLQIPPLVRRRTAAEYESHFNTYLLRRIGNVPLLDVDYRLLHGLQLELFKQPLQRPRADGRTTLSVKTVRNIVDGSLRAMYRQARKDFSALAGRDPFIDLDWPSVDDEMPDPFTAEERGQILARYFERELYYYPFVRFQFETGARPSESTAISWQRLNPAELTVRIEKSLVRGEEGDTKTKKSKRTIRISRELMEVLLTMRHPWSKPVDKIFLNKFGDPLDHHQWAKDYWGRILDELGVRRRKFYATRHTFITEMIKAGADKLALAQYCGTSLQMIQDKYCGELAIDAAVVEQALRPASQTPVGENLTAVFRQSPYNLPNNLASPTGFEPVLSA
jgi:integrase